MRTVHRNEKYEGQDISKPEINSLFKQLYSAEFLVRKLTEEIQEIQNNCNHDYYLRSTGMYDDVYHCIHCNKIDWF